MKIFKLLLSLAIAIPITTVKPQPVTAAEEISFYLSVFGEFKLSVDDLATFAETGEISPEFA